MREAANCMNAGTLAQVFGWLAIGFSLGAALMTGLALHFRTIAADEGEVRRKADVAALESQLESAGGKLAEFERLRTPRHLTETQRDKLARVLADRPVGKLTIKASVTAPDSKDLGDEIAAVFKKAGWNVPVENAIFMGGDASGLWITVQGPAIPKVANIVYDALKQADISVRDGALSDANGPTADEAWLTIGTIK